MYRTRDGRESAYDRDVVGEWCPTAPLAKASYKAALLKRKAAWPFGAARQELSLQA